MRFEIKYIVHRSKLDNLRELIQPFVRPDKFIIDRNHRSYVVRSIYFDTPDLLYYREKIEGVPYRLKLRMRTYNDSENNAPLFFEIKRKHKIPMTKDRAPYPRERAMEIMRNGLNSDDLDAGSRKEKSCQKFLYHLHRDHLQPTVLVVYDREAYESVMDNTVRITFDKNLRSALMPELREIYTDDLLAVMEEHFILEVKYNKQYPEWMRLIVNSLDLRQEAASKYCMSMDNHPEIFHKDLWSDLVHFKNSISHRA